MVSCFSSHCDLLLLRLTIPAALLHSPAAFNPGRVTTRKDPRRFLRAGQGFGGNVTKAVAAAVRDSQEAEAKPKPPRAGAFEARENPPNTELRRFYERGDLPCIIDQRNVHNKLAWKSKIESLDFHHYLPLFADGLRETEHPYKFLAREGISDLLEFGGNKILPVVPQLIIPLKNALNTRNTDVVAFTCRVIQSLATCDVEVERGPLVGQALVPYYRQLLPILNLFHSKNKNLGDEIEYGQRKGGNLGDLVQQTLNTLERFGGEDAYINIVYLVPTYESCMA